LNWKVVITGEGAVEGDYLCGYLRERGFDVFVRPRKVFDEDDCIKRIEGMDGVVATSDPYTGRVLEALKGTLKIISRFGIGTDTVDLTKAAELGIPVCNTPGLMSNQVAEHTLALLLALIRRVPQYDRRVKTGIWPPLPPEHELEGKTVGFIGFGSIARKLAQYLRGFECNFLAYDVNFDAQISSRLGVAYVPLDELIRKSDVVSLHVPATHQTMGMVDKTFLSKMKRNSLLINTARGAVVNEKDLYDALREGLIAGAALDCMQTEPPDQANSLFTLENVVITPHIAANTIEGLHRVGFAAADRICECRDGRDIQYVVNPEYRR
jgi:D-3-phosphoglycerate dehydrogenase